MKCPYCDFYTHPEVARDEADRYVSAVCMEISRAEEYGWEKNRALQTVFFGGGTPSLLTAVQLEKIVAAVADCFRIAGNAEITLEINPETVTAETACAWKAAGINRASLGVQSLDNKELLRLKREHSSEDAKKSFQILRDAGFTNISVDLMYGLEHQDLKGWMNTLETAVSWRPDHLSAYNLTIEQKTKFAVEQKLGKLSTPDEDTQVKMFLQTRKFLSSAGLAPYEISNFAKPGLESKHNLNYWLGGDYWGTGASAHSFRKETDHFKRWWNPRSLRKYNETLEAGKLPTEETETISRNKHWGERLMTGLRLTRGVDLRTLAADIGTPAPETLEEKLSSLAVDGLLGRDGSRIALTEKGMLLSNEIFRELL